MAARRPGERDPARSGIQSSLIGAESAFGDTTIDTTEARALLESEIAAWRAKSYTELSIHVGESRHVDRVGQSGTHYQLEMEVMWDHKADRDIRVIGSIDDGGWRAFAPLTESFILSKAGEFVGEE